jgi:CheY-like chemotaxis protein
LNAHADLETEETADPRTARILVVDDTATNVKLLEDLLGFHGYEVEAATSGEEALVAVRERMPDLMLLDVLMPGLSGYDVCRAVRADSTLA